MATPMTLTSQEVGLGLVIPTALITIIRLGIRARVRNLGLDDAFAASSLVGLLVVYIAYFVHMDPHLLARCSFITRYMMYYTFVLGFYWCIWSARLSILFIVIRITPPHMGTRRALHFVAWSFAVVFGILVAQVIWVCEKKTAWKMTLAPKCPIGPPVVIAQLISDTLADSILIIVPLRLLWQLDKSCPQRRRLIVVFSSSIIMTIAAVVHGYCILRVVGYITLFSGFIEGCSSLLVCNLAIIVSLVCRIFRRGRSAYRANDFSLDLRSHGNCDTFRFRQGIQSFAIEIDTVVHVEVGTHILNEDRTDPEAPSLPSKSNSATHDQQVPHDHGLGDCTHAHGSFKHSINYSKGPSQVVMQPSAKPRIDGPTL